MMRVVRYAWLFLLLFSLGIAMAQNPKVDFKKVREAYINATSLHMVANVTAVEAGKTEEGTLGKAEMRRSELGYYSRFIDDEIISNKEATLILDHRAKTIEYYKGEKEVQQTANPGEVDWLNDFGGNLWFAGLEGDKLHYVLKDPGGEIRQTDIYINNESYFIERVIYTYARPTDDVDLGAERVIIDYVKIDTNEFSNNAFSIDEYLTLNKGIPVTTAKYSSYELMVD